MAKKTFCITVEEKLIEEFKKIADNKSINMSNLLSKYIDRWVEENKNNG